MLIVPNMYFFCTSSRSTCKHRFSAEEVISKSDTSMHSGISVLHMRADTCSPFLCQRSLVIELMCLEEPGEFTHPFSSTTHKSCWKSCKRLTCIELYKIIRSRHARAHTYKKSHYTFQLIYACRSKRQPEHATLL